MYLAQIFACFALGLAASWVTIQLVLKRITLHGETERSRDFHHTHTAPIPRLGGVGIVAGYIACVAVIPLISTLSTGSVTTLAIIVSSSLAMFALGLWDDFLPLGAKFKLAAQIAIAAAVYFTGVQIELVKSPLTYVDVPLGATSFFATVFWLVAMTNLINLIDGIDGLAAGICLMLMFLLANVGLDSDSAFTVLLAISLAGALVGFLRFNYPPAKIYLGDGGAYFLGFLIGIISIVNSNKGTVAAALIAPAFALALPLVDVSLAVARRALRGLPIFRPDRHHIHHRMLTLGISHEGTLLNLYTVSLMCLFLGFGIFAWQGRMLPLYTGLLFLVLLIAGKLSGFTKNWFEIRSQLGKSLALRKETRYALTLSRWFILEIDRHHSPEELTRDYQFVVRKLRFARITVILPDNSSQTWTFEQAPSLESELYQATHEISDGTIIEFFAHKAAMSDTLFYVLGDLAAESWYRAASQWKAVNKPPLSFYVKDKAAPSAENLVPWIGLKESSFTV